MQQLADGRATAQVTAPVVVALGKQRKQRIRRLVRGKGRLMDEVQDVIEQVKSSFHDGAEGKIFVLRCLADMQQILFSKTMADLLDVVRRWHQEKRTVIAALHDVQLVKANFPQTLLLARQSVAWGDTAEVLTPENLLTARRMCEAFHDDAAACAAPTAA